MGFFDQPQGAAIFKHAALKGYVKTWASKLGRFAAGNRIAYLDGYAGTGAYADGSPGSPAVVLDVASHLGELRDVRCFFVESQPKRYEQLKKVVDEAPAGHHAVVLPGDLEECLDYVLEEVGESPLLAFLDPFGLGLPFDQLAETLFGRPSWRNGQKVGTTEILVNFVHAGVYRTAGKLNLNSTNPTQIASASAITQKVNNYLDGEWWQNEWLSRVRGPGDAGNAVAAIRDEYVRRLLERAGSDWMCYQVAVADAWQGESVYDLLLFTQHLQGYWYFNEAVSLARDVFQTHCDPNFGLQQQLWEPRDVWIGIIERNVAALLEEGADVRVIDHAQKIYGETLGYARGTHVRTAIKNLYKRGVTTTTGVSKGGQPIHDLVVKPLPRTTPSDRKSA